MLCAVASKRGIGKRGVDAQSVMPNEHRKRGINDAARGEAARMDYEWMHRIPGLGTGARPRAA